MKIRILIILLLTTVLVRAQSDLPKNHIFAEVLGNGLLYSVNYERYITENLTLRAGISDWHIDSDGDMISINDHVTVFPFAVNWILGETENKTELGVGFNLFYGKDIDDGDEYSSVLPTCIIGYRYQYKNGWIFRAALTPFYMPKVESIMPWFGFSYGIRF